MARNYTALPWEYLEEMSLLDDSEFGRLMRGLIRYSRDGTAIEVSGNERFYVSRVMAQEDRFQANYDETSSARREAGKAGAAARWQNDGKNGKRISANGKNGNTETKTKTETETISPNGESIAPEGAAPAKEAKKSFGQFGWVKLTESEYNRLLNDFGEAEVKRCIAYVDESAQSSGNKNRWRDWNLVVRRCHRDGWGKQGGKQTAPTPKPENRQASAAALKQDMSWMDELLAQGGTKSE